MQSNFNKQFVFQQRLCQLQFLLRPIVDKNIPLSLIVLIVHNLNYQCRHSYVNYDYDFTVYAV